MNQFIADEMAGLIKSRFDSTLADKLMDEAVREPEWLVDMMKKPKVSNCTACIHWHTHACTHNTYFHVSCESKTAQVYN
jgi:hypothetical protein